MKQITFNQLKTFLKESAMDDAFNDFIKLRDKAPEYVYWTRPRSRTEGGISWAIDYAQKHNLFYALGTHEDWSEQKSFVYADRRQSKVEAYVVDLYKNAAAHTNAFFFEKVEIFDSTGKLVKTFNYDEFIKLPDSDEEVEYEVDTLDDKHESPEPVAKPNEYFYGNGKSKYDDI